MHKKNVRVLFRIVIVILGSILFGILNGNYILGFLFTGGISLVTYFIDKKDSK